MDWDLCEKDVDSSLVWAWDLKGVRGTVIHYTARGEAASWAQRQRQWKEHKINPVCDNVKRITAF